MAIQFLVILVPVVLVMMGFAVDLGRIYLIRGELNQAASAMALAAASQLNATDGATAAGDAAAQVTANKYNFGSIVVGDQTAALTSTVPGPAYFSTAAEALSAYGQSTATSTADPTTARHATVNLSADAPLLFWSLLSLGQSRKTSIAASAVAGVSPPVCTACAIEPFAIIDPSGGTDTTDFGLIQFSTYTFGFQCNPPASAANSAAISGTTSRVAYVIINKSDPNPIATAYASDDDELFRDGAQGLVPSTTPGVSCSTITASQGATAETLWPSASTFQACGAATPLPAVQDAVCGLSTRLTDSTPTSCANVTNISTLATLYAPDTDITSNTDLTALDYTAYAGNNRRLLTMPVIDSVTNLNVLGFRQFLLIPTPGTTPLANNPADGDGRFVAMYLGTVAPVKQGRFDGSCGVTTGPGKVVLLQ